MKHIFRLDDKNGNTLLIPKKKIEAISVQNDLVLIQTTNGTIWEVVGPNQMFLDLEIDFLDKALT